jgi:multiple sugar transport system ATP-binding protein
VLDDGGLKIRLADGTTLPVPPQRVDRYGPFKGQDMTLGLRPEHLTEISDVEKPNVGRITALVDVVEPMGMETLVHFFIGGEPVCARVDPNTHAVPGEPLQLAADLNNMHLIDTASGKVV